MSELETKYNFEDYDLSTALAKSWCFVRQVERSAWPYICEICGAVNCAMAIEKCEKYMDILELGNILPKNTRK